MSDISVENEVIGLDLESDFADGRNISAPPGDGSNQVIALDLESDIADDINLTAPPGDGSNPFDDNGKDDAAEGGQKRGRKGSNLWTLYTNDANPQQHKSAVCKHCYILVNHHKKSEAAKTHLNNCVPFRKLVNGMEEEMRPDWYNPNKKPRKTHTAATSSDNCSSRQCSIKEFAIPALAKQQKAMFQKHIAMHYYATGSSFQRVEDTHLMSAIKILRPDQSLLPSRKQLATNLLDACHEDVKSKVAKSMNGANVCLITDGWSNVRNDAIINYMAASPNFTVFLESVSTGQQGHDHKFIANDIERVIREHASTVFAGAVTDNTSTNKKAWGLLKSAFPSRYFLGCCSHGLYLFVKDIFAAPQTKKAGQVVATYPDQYPFEPMVEFIACCKDVVKYFHNHHVAKAQLRELQLSTGDRTLVRAAPTRWGTIQGMCETLLQSERHLHNIVNARDFLQGTSSQKKERSQIKLIVTDEAFVSKLEKVLAILAPIEALIVKYQSDKVPISEVMPDFQSLPEEFNKVMSSKIITVQEFEYLVALAQRRFQFMYGVAHGLSYLLDPRYIGEGLSTDERRSLEEMLINTPVDDVTPIDDGRKQNLFIQFTDYFISATQERSANSFRYQMLSKGAKTVLQYWQTDGCQWADLQGIAVRLFSMVTSSAASERNFSTMGFIHSKLRNSLSVKTVEKLVFIKSNMGAFSTCPTSDDYTSDCDSD
jgi:hypothetical protein